MKLLRTALLTLTALSLAACDSEKVSWAFVSNPSGNEIGSGGAVIVIVWSSSSRAGTGDRSLVEQGVQADGPVTVRLATTADLALIERRTSIEVRCPSLPAGSVVATGATALELPQSATLWEVDVRDCSEVHAAAIGRGRLVVAERGNVIVLEHLGGLVVFGAGADVELLPPGYIVDPTGPFLALVHPREPRRELRGTAPPSTDDRLEWNAGRESIRILGPQRRLLAEVPRDAVTLSGVSRGLFLRGSFPNGLGRLRQAFTIMTPTDNRYLLRIDSR